MHGSRIRLRIKAASERGRRMANARWKIESERRQAEMPTRIHELAKIEVENMPCKEGDVLGYLQWHDFRTGKIRRWMLRIGDRADRITVELPHGKRTASHGWTWFLTTLRKHITKNI